MAAKTNRVEVMSGTPEDHEHPSEIDRMADEAVRADHLKSSLAGRRVLTDSGELQRVDYFRRPRGQPGPDDDAIQCGTAPSPVPIEAPGTCCHAATSRR